MLLVVELAMFQHIITLLDWRTMLNYDRLSYRTCVFHIQTTHEDVNDESEDSCGTESQSWSQLLH